MIKKGAPYWKTAKGKAHLAKMHTGLRAMYAARKKARDTTATTKKGNTHGEITDATFDAIFGAIITLIYGTATRLGVSTDEIARRVGEQLNVRKR